VIKNIIEYPIISDQSKHQKTTNFMIILRLLLLEDDEMDAGLIKKVLERSGIKFEATIVSNKKDFLTTIASHSFDAILADNSVPQFDANEALQVTRDNNINIPFILVTGTVSEEFAVNIMKSGAADYILKDRLQRLPNAIKSAISKHALEMLRQKNFDDIVKNEALLKNSEKLAHFGSWEADMVNLTMRWSEETFKILEYEPTEITPSLENFLLKLHPDDLIPTKGTIDDTIDHLSLQKFKCRMINKDGSIKNLENEIFITRDEKGAVTRINGLTRDITETALALEQLQKSEANLHTIFDNADTGYVLLDNSWRLKSFNHPIYQFSEELLDKPFEKENSLLDSIAAAKHNEIKTNVQLAMNGIYTRYEVNYPQENGLGKWYSVICSPVLDEGKKVLGIIIAERDITRKKLLELQEKKMTADLIQRNNDLEQFAYIVSHNLRGPVATILGISELIYDKNLVEQERKYFMDSLADSVKKLDNVIIDLNHITHAKSTVNEKREQVNFSQLVSEVISSIPYIIEDEPLHIKNDFTQVDGIESIKSYMHSIFYNLISNSIKYRNPNVPLALEITSHKENDKIELHFKDNGMGIDLNKKGDQLFGLYKRFHPGTAEGKGLGLFMVKTQVETIGGKISVKSEVNLGTEFIIEFDGSN